MPVTPPEAHVPAASIGSPEPGSSARHSPHHGALGRPIHSEAVASRAPIGCRPLAWGPVGAPCSAVKRNEARNVEPSERAGGRISFPPSVHPSRVVRRVVPGRGLPVSAPFPVSRFPPSSPPLFCFSSSSPSRQRQLPLVRPLRACARHAPCASVGRWAWLKTSVAAKFLFRVSDQRNKQTQTKRLQAQPILGPARVRRQSLACSTRNHDDDGGTGQGKPRYTAGHDDGTGELRKIEIKIDPRVLASSAKAIGPRNSNVVGIRSSQVSLHCPPCPRYRHHD